MKSCFDLQRQMIQELVGWLSCFVLLHFPFHLCLKFVGWIVSQEFDFFAVFQGGFFVCIEADCSDSSISCFV